DLGYPGAEEIENILYRAVTDRNVRVVWITPFTDAQTGRTITDAAVYEDVVENLSARIERHGLILSSSFSAFGAYEPSPLLIFAAYGVAAAGILLLGCFFRLSRRWEILLAVAGMGACAALWCAESLWGYNLFTPLLAFAASVIFPCLSLWYAYERLSALRRDTLSRTLGAYTGILLVSLGIAVAGGLFVGALQSGSDYLLAIANFRGVKLSQLLPLAFAVYAVLRFLCPPREILAGRKFILILGAFGLICGVGYYILRTGNAGVSVLEQRFRNWLELLLIARPRTKEFLVAWPCLAAAAVLVTKGKRAYSWPFAVLAASGYASAVNTFCHARSPLWLSLTRTLLGAALGAAIGLILIAITYSGPSVKKDAPET
ncbi:MAG TPA: hypothetical protein DD735_06320, partial [Clostridiales bacterium]|nr:hypothetical protein [Clostridiales bacterium]